MLPSMAELRRREATVGVLLLRTPTGASMSVGQSDTSPRDVRYCECEGDHAVFRWRGDPRWWSCVGCDGRVRPLTAAEQAERGLEVKPTVGIPTETDVARATELAKEIPRGRGSEIRHFLVVKRFGRLESVQVYDDDAAALRAYEKAERECGWVTAIRDEEPAAAECVLLGADRLSSCIATHGNWFDEPNRLLDELLSEE